MSEILSKIPNISIKKLITLNFYDCASLYLYPLKQGKEEESTPIVQPGTEIKSGDLIARGKKPRSGNIHSAVGGTFLNTHKLNLYGDERTENVMAINFGGKFKTYNNIFEVDTTVTTLSDIIKILDKFGIQDNDISNFGQALFSKLTNGIAQIVVNAVELEPYSILEEKILSLHTKEIAQSINFLIQLSKLHGKNSLPEIVCNSEIWMSKKNFFLLLKSQNREKLKYRKLSFHPKQIPENQKMNPYSQFMAAYQKLQGTNSSEQEKILIVSPSTLLLFYEILYYRKPMIEKYIQVVTSLNSSYFLRVMIGTPINHILMQLDLVTSETNNFFYGNIMDKNIVKNFSMPVTKDISHFFALDEKQYSKYQKLIKNWGEET